MCVTEPRKTNKSKTTDDGMGSWKFSTFKSIRIIAFFDLVSSFSFSEYTVTKLVCEASDSDGKVIKMYDGNFSPAIAHVSGRYWKLPLPSDYCHISYLKLVLNHTEDAYVSKHFAGLVYNSIYTVWLTLSPQIVAVIFAVYRGVCLSILLGKIPTKSDRELAASSSRLSGANMIVIKNPGNSSTRDNYGESSLQDGTYTSKLKFCYW